MKRYITFGAIIFFLGSGNVVMAASAPTFSDIVTHCESCHGANGNSHTPSVPQLNGQSADYLFLRLKEFSDPTSQTRHAFDNMWPVVTAINDDTRRQIADYFARQRSPSVLLTGALSGEQLYKQGLPAESLTACTTCHGPNAEGRSNAPRLAGQPVEYLKTQLWSFNFGTRVHGPMNAAATKLTSERIDALATYLAGR